MGRVDDEEVVDDVQAGMMFIAWRCLYAEIVKTREENEKRHQRHQRHQWPNLKKAYKRCLQMIISRVTAYGEKWRKWCKLNRGTSKKSIIPLRCRNRKLIQQDMHGDYKINQELIDEYKSLL